MSEPQIMTPEDLQWRVKLDDNKRGVDPDSIILIDLRGTDFKGGIIYNALHIPADDFDNCMITVFKMIAATGISDVCFYDTSSSGKARSVAGDFQDFGKRMKIVKYPMGDITTYELKGGLEAWVAGGKDYTRFMRGYDEAAWAKQKDKEVLKI